QAVPSKIDCRQSIEEEKEEMKKKEEKNKEYRAVLARVPSSPTPHRRSRARFLLCEETECLPVWGERSR
ncbi:hypothetical protein BHM03_00036127, partial [Ensete ventricosum]